MDQDETTVVRWIKPRNSEIIDSYFTANLVLLAYRKTVLRISQQRRTHPISIPAIRGYKENRNPPTIDGKKTSRNVFQKFLYRTFPDNYKRRLRLFSNCPITRADRTKVNYHCKLVNKAYYQKDLQYYHPTSA
ncbi:hypothetical protein J6590_088515 [Homalodisca vitripennis]|nr:hypothetical protein J6590_088515 [Homalodisca vitripennis]